MQYPEFEDPFNLSEDTIKNIIEDPDGRQRIQAYMHSLSDQLFKNALSSIKQLNQEWAFPHQEITEDSTTDTQERPLSQETPLTIEKKDINQPKKTLSSPQINHIPTQDIPKKTESPYTQGTLSLNSEFIISDPLPEEKQPLITADSSPLAAPLPEMQIEKIEKEELEKDPVKAKIDSEELENRYKKRQESLQDILKKKGNIS